MSTQIAPNHTVEFVNFQPAAVYRLGENGELMTGATLVALVEKVAEQNMVKAIELAGQANEVPDIVAEGFYVELYKQIETARLSLENLVKEMTGLSTQVVAYIHDTPRNQHAQFEALRAAFPDGYKAHGASQWVCLCDGGTGRTDIFGPNFEAVLA